MRPLIPSPRQNTCSKAYEDHDAGTRGLTSAWKRSMVRNLSGKRTRRVSLNRDCPDQTDSSNHVTLWDGSNYKRAA